MIVYTRDADADRAFFRDILELPAVDSGGGWLIFALPPSEIAFHPADANDVHEIYLVTDDLRATTDGLKARGVVCDPPVEERWGTRTAIHLPGGGRLGLYEPKHPTAIQLAKP
jgi:catechol 2,3-dioxygenase-like lactoylglutathione lyase family enzyme